MAKRKRPAAKPVRRAMARAKKAATSLVRAVVRSARKTAVPVARRRRAAAAKAGRRTPRSAGRSAGKFVYLFGRTTDGSGTMKPLLGGKGANLAEMCRIGLPVPPGFTLTTEVCTYYYAHNRSYPSALRKQIEQGIAAIERQTGKTFGDLANPLLVSVRSGARDSMPGMMDTILNLGLNDETVEALSRKTGNPRFAWDCYRRFVQMYGDVVLGVQKRPDEDHEPFETVIEDLKRERYHQHLEDTKLTVEDLQELVRRFQALVKERVGREFPASPWDQLMGAVGAVFGSWMNDRAIVYRRKYNIPSEWGTAVNVQAMVYGNTGDRSGSGVAFTRNPANGAKEFYGEFLINAQGEDVVAGVRTPEPVADLKKHLPKAYHELERIRQVLERTSRTCRTSSSPSRTASSTCCRRATASARRWQRSSSRWTCRRRS
jgi:pyruvate, orthophosphate dikinase